MKLAFHFLKSFDSSRITSSSVEGLRHLDEPDSDGTCALDTPDRTQLFDAAIADWTSSDRRLPHPDSQPRSHDGHSLRQASSRGQG